MTSPTCRRTAKRRRRKLNKRGKLLFGLLAVMVCITIWNALHRNSEENEPSQETAAVSNTDQKKRSKRKLPKIRGTNQNSGSKPKNQQLFKRDRFQRNSHDCQKWRNRNK